MRHKRRLAVVGLLGLLLLGGLCATRLAAKGDAKALLSSLGVPYVSELKEVRAYMYEDYPDVEFIARVELEGASWSSIALPSWSQPGKAETFGYQPVEWWDVAGAESWYVNPKLTNAAAGVRGRVLYIVMRCKTADFPQAIHDLMSEYPKNASFMPAQGEISELQYP